MTARRLRPPWPARLACAVLVALYPPWIRRQYGGDMRQFFLDGWRDARALPDRRSGVAHDVRALWNLLSSAFVAWFDTPTFVAERSWRRLDASWSEGSTSAGSRTFSPDLIAVLRQSMRGLMRARAFTAVSVVTLALGVGATTTVFSAVNGVLLSALPYPAAERLVTLAERSPAPALKASWVSEETLRDWQQRCRRVQPIAAWRLALVTLTAGGVPERLEGYAVTSEYFDVMRIPMTLGRGFTRGEDVPGGGKVVVLSHALWQRRFGSDPRVVGSVVTIDAAPHTIVGVAGRRLEFPERAEFWLPLGLEFRPGLRAFRYLGVVARVAPRSSIDDARADLARVSKAVAREAPETNAGWSADLQPLADEVAGDIRPFLVGALIAVALLLLVAVANVGNLFVARMTDRQEELAVRRALGAGPARLLHMFMADALIISAGAGLCGVIAANWGTSALAAAIQDWLPNTETIAMDGRVLGFSLLVTLVIGALLGLLPAALAPRSSIGYALRAGQRTVVGHARVHRLRSGLLTVQVALAVALLVGAALLARSLHYLHHVDPGFDPRNVLTFEVNLPDGSYNDATRVAAIDRLRAGLGALPGVEAVGTVFPMPMVLGSVPFRIATPEMGGRPASQRPMAHLRKVSPGYFEAMRIPLLRGRYVADGDRPGRPAVVVINQTLARRVFGARDPIGQRLTFGEPAAPDAPWLTVVGVVGDVLFRRLWNERDSEAYSSVQQDPFYLARLVVRTRQQPDRLVRDIAAVVRQIDPGMPLADVRTAEAIVGESLKVNRVTGFLLASFAASSAMLSLVGVLGVLTVVVNRRRREIGIRVVLGAPPRRVAGLVVATGMAPVALGTAIGLALACAATRLLAAQVHGVGAMDPWSFAGGGAGFVLAAALVCAWPALRAVRLSPASVMRTD